MLDALEITVLGQKCKCLLLSIPCGNKPFLILFFWLRWKKEEKCLPSQWLHTMYPRPGVPALRNMLHLIEWLKSGETTWMSLWLSMTFSRSIFTEPNWPINGYMKGATNPSLFSPSCWYQFSSCMLGCNLVFDFLLGSGLMQVTFTCLPYHNSFYHTNQGPVLRVEPIARVGHSNYRFDHCGNEYQVGPLTQ